MPRPPPAPQPKAAPLTALPAPSGAPEPAQAPHGSSVFNPTDWPIAWMARAERQHARNANLLLAPLGIQHREFRLLAFLGSAGDLEIGALAERAVLERSTVSKMAERLVAQGLVQRGIDTVDRRRAPLRLTPAGQQRLAAASEVVQALFHRYQAGRDRADAARFLAELQDFHQRVRAAAPGPSAQPRPTQHRRPA